MEKCSYITGFVDGEGCFSVSFSMRSKMSLGIEVRPSFSVSQNRRSKDVIMMIQGFFKCGGVRYSASDQNYKFEVRAIDDLVKKIIPHFEKYPLMTSKKNDFEAFSEICNLVRSNHHRSEEGLRRIIELSEAVNRTGKKKYERKDLLKLIAR